MLMLTCVNDFLKKKGKEKNWNSETDLCYSWKKKHELKIDHLYFVVCYCCSMKLKIDGWNLSLSSSSRYSLISDRDKLHLHIRLLPVKFISSFVCLSNIKLRHCEALDECMQLFLDLNHMGSTLACCFGTGFCSLCCSACPSCKGSTSTRLVYSIFLFACLTIFFTTLTPDIRVILKDKSHLRDELTVDCAQRNCTYSGGFRAVYRLSLGTTIFFGLLSILVRERLIAEDGILCLDDQSENIKWSSSENSEWILGD